MAAFGPNIVLDGLPANIEDIVAAIRIHGEEIFDIFFGGIAIRCGVTLVNADGKHDEDGEPLRWLGKNRPRRHGTRLRFGDTAGGKTFGVNAATSPSSQSKIISVGDGVQVLAEKYT